VSTVLSDLEFEYVWGVIEPQAQDPVEEEIVLDINYPEIQEDGQFKFIGDSSLTFKITMDDSQIPGLMTIDCKGYDQFDETVQLVDLNTGLLPEVILPGDSEYDIVFDSDHYNVNELLSVLPQRIEFKINVTAGDGESDLIFQRGEIMGVAIKLESLLALASDTWVLPTKDGEVLVNEEEIALEQKIYDSFQTASLRLTYTNTTGVAVSGDIIISDTRMNVDEQMHNYGELNTDVVDVIQIPELQVTGERDSQVIDIAINQTDLNYFMNDVSFIGSRLHLLSTGEQPLAGEVKLTAKIIMNMQVSNDLVSD
jgi:hypothetical protein